jgi:hypothetical protein
MKGFTAAAAAAQHKQQTTLRKNRKEESESKCRLCKEYEEAIDHVASGKE